MNKQREAPLPSGLLVNVPAPQAAVTVRWRANQFGRRYLYSALIVLFAMLVTFAYVVLVMLFWAKESAWEARAYVPPQAALPTPHSDRGTAQ